MQHTEMRRNIGDRIGDAKANGHTNGRTNGANSDDNEANGQPSVNANGHTDSVTSDLDVVIVGAGFAGVYLLYLLRKEGLNAKIVEAGHGLGGVWYWNSYPGARVDSPYPTYALKIPEVYKTWSWTEEYPSDKELRRYFQHMDDVLNISKDVIYGEKIIKATFDESTNKWSSETDKGSTFTSRFFCPCIGFAAKRLFPNWPGLEDVYKGQILHSSFWPSEGIDMRGKKVAVVGTGATGVQLSQEIARDADKLTCFVRTPNLTWPMRLKPLTPERLAEDKRSLEHTLEKLRYTKVGGFAFDETTRKVFDDTAEERNARLEEFYQGGGYRVFFSGYIDILLDQAANDEIYHFWRRKTHERMTDPAKAEILAPAKPPHPFAGKRPSLEQDYYEMMDKPNVTLVDVKNNPVTHLVPNGIVAADGTVHEAEIIVLATGFDAVTGGLKDIDITGLGGLTLQERWNDGTHAYLGMAVSGFPNLFYTYGPFSPSAYANGPVVVESQADWIVSVMRKMRDEGHTRIHPTHQAEREWKEKVIAIHAMTLRDNIEGSWYLGLNVPGKKREPLNFSGGIPMYRKDIQDAILPDWKGFMLS